MHPLCTQVGRPGLAVNRAITRGSPEPIQRATWSFQGLCSHTAPSKNAIDVRAAPQHGEDLGVAKRAGGRKVSMGERAHVWRLEKAVRLAPTRLVCARRFLARSCRRHGRECDLCYDWQCQAPSQCVRCAANAWAGAGDACKGLPLQTRDRSRASEVVRAGGSPSQRNVSGDECLQAQSHSCARQACRDGQKGPCCGRRGGDGRAQAASC